MSDDVHEVYALRYAHHDRQSSENFVFGDPHDILQPLAYYVWVIAGPRGPVLVDTGFDQAMADKRQRTLVKPIEAGLRSIGIDPDSIRDIIVTHLHYDHCGNHDLFPRARYHIQDAEVAYATGRYMCHQMMRIPFEADDIAAMVRKVFAGRVVFHDGTDEIAPGITVHHVGGHSKGLQCVRVKTRRGHVVLASDVSHLYGHFAEGRVFPVTFCVGDALEAYTTIRKLADSDDHIVPGHDPAVARWYPPARPGLEGLVVRLDADPRP
jgi:glyoxylase-like metal-dependent hydrolase (beta-lactamase superfamily II)